MILMAPFSGSSSCQSGRSRTISSYRCTKSAAHGHHHGFAVLQCGAARLEVGHQVGRHAGNARLRAHHFFKRRPFALQAALVRFFLVFGQLVNLVVDQPQVSLFSRSLASRDS